MPLLFLIAPLLARPLYDATRPSTDEALARHIFTGKILECSPPLALVPNMQPKRFAKVIVDMVQKGTLATDEEVTIECSEECEVEVGESVNCCTDAEFRLLPGGLEAMALRRRREEWPRLLHVLRSNWLTSRYLRTEASKPKGRRSLSGVVRLTRDVGVRECGWLDKDLRRGTRFRVYRGPTYGCISPTGIAVTFLGEDDGPFFELPRDALAKGPAAGGSLEFSDNV